MKYRIIVIALASVIFSTASIASHELESNTQNLASPDGHISWHEFRHELIGFSGIEATISENGLVTLRGHVDDGIMKQNIEAIARKIRGATEIHNYIFTD